MQLHIIGGPSSPRARISLTRPRRVPVAATATTGELGAVAAMAYPPSGDPEMYFQSQSWIPTKKRGRPGQMNAAMPSSTPPRASRKSLPGAVSEYKGVTHHVRTKRYEVRYFAVIYMGFARLVVKGRAVCRGCARCAHGTRRAARLLCATGIAGAPPVRACHGARCKRGLHEHASGCHRHGRTRTRARDFGMQNTIPW